MPPAKAFAFASPLGPHSAMGVVPTLLEDTMTEQQAIDMLRECQKSGDTEAAHSDADDVLCQLLSALGYNNVVLEWNKVLKWYA